jgi:hypothetical protein
MSKHMPLIRLQAARRAYQVAQEACPHWDYESGSAAWACCYDVRDAWQELKRARKEATK